MCSCFRRHEKQSNPFHLDYIDPANLNIAPTGHGNRLPTDIREQRTHDRQDRACGFSRRTRPAQRNILERRRPIPLLGRLLLPRYSQRHLLPIRCRDERTRFLGCSQPRGDMSKCNGICADSERGTPFFCDCLCETRDSGFGEGVVGLARVAVEA